MQQRLQMNSQGEEFKEPSLSLSLLSQCLSRFLLCRTWRSCIITDYDCISFPQASGCTAPHLIESSEPCVVGSRGLQFVFQRHRARFRPLVCRGNNRYWLAFLSSSSPANCVFPGLIVIGDFIWNLMHPSLNLLTTVTEEEGCVRVVVGGSYAK